MSPGLPPGFYCWTVIYAFSVCGIVNVQFLFLFYCNSILKQLFLGGGGRDGKLKYHYIEKIFCFKDVTPLLFTVSRLTVALNKQ